MARSRPLPLKSCIGGYGRMSSISHADALVESLQVKLRNNVADQPGATRGMFHAGTLEIPIRMVQSVAPPIDAQRKDLA
jgi:hypothetical protein